MMAVCLSVAAPPTVGALLEAAVERLADDGVADVPPTVELLAERALGRSRGGLAAEARRPPTAGERGRIQRLVERVAAGEPLAYVLGWASFLGREFAVTRDTLIPRRDTEELVELVFDQLEQRTLLSRPRVLELGTGSGCVAITLALRWPTAEVVATDISAAALAVAERNIRRHDVADRVTLRQGDLFAPLVRAAERPFDLIVSNPPYIPTGRIGAMGRAVAENEPHLALDGGGDGLDFHRRILAESPPYLAAGGRVFLEHEHDQGAAARQIAGTCRDFDQVQTLRDRNGRDRVLAVRALRPR